MLKQLYIKNFTLIDELNIALYQASPSSPEKREPERVSSSAPSVCSWVTEPTPRPSRQAETAA